MTSKLTETEYKIAELIWEREPLASGELVKLCEQEFLWKKSTTYTILKKLCKAGVFQNKEAIITSLISRERYKQIQGETFIEDAFGGSLPQFLTSFMNGKRLSDKQISELQKIIEQNGEN